MLEASHVPLERSRVQLTLGARRTVRAGDRLVLAVRILDDVGTPALAGRGRAAALLADQHRASIPDRELA
jgi:hypothetical protein